jgi:hypothetical protein
MILTPVAQGLDSCYFHQLNYQKTIGGQKGFFDEFRFTPRANQCGIQHRVYRIGAVALQQNFVRVPTD